MMKLYILRHGETQWNVQKRLQGASDTELNEKGIALAEKTGEAAEGNSFLLLFYQSFKESKGHGKAGAWQQGNSHL